MVKWNDRIATIMQKPFILPQVGGFLTVQRTIDKRHYCHFVIKDTEQRLPRQVDVSARRADWITVTVMSNPPSPFDFLVATSKQPMYVVSHGSLFSNEKSRRIVLLIIPWCIGLVCGTLYCQCLARVAFGPSCLWIMLCVWRSPRTAAVLPEDQGSANTSLSGTICRISWVSHLAVSCLHRLLALWVLPGVLEILPLLVEAQSWSMQETWSNTCYTVIILKQCIINNIAYWLFSPPPQTD